MRKLALIAGFTSLALLSSLALAAAGPRAAATTPALVMAVKTASVRPIRMRGYVAIGATGEVGTPGYANPHLSIIPTFVPPADGIYDFNFEATPPTGMRPQHVTPIAAPPRNWRAPSGLKGIRVHSKTNTVTAMLPGK